MSVWPRDMDRRRVLAPRKISELTHLFVLCHLYGGSFAPMLAMTGLTPVLARPECKVCG
jgi:hypothetical protein